jgi:hypothetical protein
MTELPVPPTTSSSTPPTYTIDLSLPPCERYVQVTTDYARIVSELPCLYDEALSYLRLPTWFFHILGRLLLRHLHSAEQTEELRGISKTCGLPMYLLVAYNVFLDLLMGCTSGGVVVADEVLGPSMMHFRTLDWSMDLLRQAIVQFEFVDRPGGEVIARTVGYVGFVGVLTGVRKGMSVSLNFRPYHNAHGLSWANMKYYWNTLMVLLGRRPSISTLLRDCLLPRPSSPARKRTRLIKKRGAKEPESQIPATTLPPYTSTDITRILPSLRTTVAYLIFCTGSETLILEKDFLTANIFRSSSFINTTNHDIAFETAQEPQAAQSDAAHTQARANNGLLNAGMQEIVDDSIDRKTCLRETWLEWKQERGERAAERGVKLSELKEWVQKFPVCNESTHFVCIMDARAGVFRWVRKFEEDEV